MKRDRRFLLAAALLAAAVFLAGCSAHLDYPRTATTALPPPDGAGGPAIAPQLAERPGQSAFRLLSSGPDSLVARLALVDAASRSVDAQYFNFEDDLAGNLFVERLFAAAERGVRVRLLVDDWHQCGGDPRLAGISAHPNVQVRVFNPAGGPRWFLGARVFAYGFGPARVRNRMHNKAFIVDNTVAIVGGRNIADFHFTAPGDFHADDLDLLAAGPIARSVSAAFDAYWNDRLSVPIEAFVSERYATRRLLAVRRGFVEWETDPKRRPYIERLTDYPTAKGLENGRLPLIWAAGEVLSDRPAKALGTDDPAAALSTQLMALLEAARSEVLIVSPYFVPGEAGMQWFRRARERGVVVKVLTTPSNPPTRSPSTRATRRIAPSCSAWAWNCTSCGRTPGRRRAERERGPRSVFALHAKCYVVDRKAAFVGSCNFDRRSLAMDGQNGIVARSNELAAQLVALFALRTSPRYAYRVTLRDPPAAGSSALLWFGEADGETVPYRTEPLAGPWRRFKAWAVRWFAPESWL